MGARGRPFKLDHSELRKEEAFRIFGNLFYFVWFYKVFQPVVTSKGYG
jgi:hypothetical protein